MNLICITRTLKSNDLKAGWDATHFIPTVQQEHKESTHIKSLLDSLTCPYSALQFLYFHITETRIY